MRHRVPRVLHWPANVEMVGSVRKSDAAGERAKPFMARWLWTVCVCVVVACSGSTHPTHRSINTDDGPTPRPDASHPDSSVPDASERDAEIPDASLADGGKRCDFYGDESEAPSLVPLLWQFDGGYADLTDAGQAAPLWRAFQGGHVLLVGARIYNLDGCNASLSATLRYPGDGGITAQETRSVDFSVPDQDGGIAQLAFWNVANVPACPNNFDRAVYGQPWSLEVTVRDREARTATFTQDIVPSCDYENYYDRWLCECECDPYYFFGKCNSPPQDGGP